MRAGSKEEVVSFLGVRSEPSAEELRDGESNQEIGDRQQQPPLLTFQPLFTLDLATKGTMTVITGVVRYRER